MNYYLMTIEAEGMGTTEAQRQRWKKALEELKASMDGWGEAKLFAVPDEAGFKRFKKELEKACR